MTKQDNNDKKIRKNFYAVVVGKQPGIYNHWSGPGGAQEQVQGFASARYRGFVTHIEAEHWLSEMQKNPTQPVTPTTPKPSPHDTLVKNALTAGKVVLYSDGSCLRNPGPGGFGVVLLFAEKRKELSGGFHLTTNNRMELTACIKGLSALKKACTVELFTDSQYVINGITRGWALRWQKNGWLRTGGLPAENPDLWESLLSLCKVHHITWHWVKGHAGNEGNERCDFLATQSSANSALHDHDYEYEKNKGS